MVYSLTQHIPEKCLIEFCKKNHIHKLAVFGSAIKGTLRPESDIDILIDFEEKHIPGLIRLAGMQIELSEMLGREVDLRTPEDLSRYFRDEVVRTAEVQYEAV